MGRAPCPLTPAPEANSQGVILKSCSSQISGQSCSLGPLPLPRPWPSVPLPHCSQRGLQSSPLTFLTPASAALSDSLLLQDANPHHARKAQPCPLLCPSLGVPHTLPYQFHNASFRRPTDYTPLPAGLTLTPPSNLPCLERSYTSSECQHGFPPA